MEAMFAEDSAAMVRAVRSRPTRVRTMSWKRAALATLGFLRNGIVEGRTVNGLTVIGERQRSYQGQLARAWDGDVWFLVKALIILSVALTIYTLLVVGVCYYFFVRDRDGCEHHGEVAAEARREAEDPAEPPVAEGVRRRRNDGRGAPLASMVIYTTVAGRKAHLSHDCRHLRQYSSRQSKMWEFCHTCADGHVAYRPEDE